MAQIDIEILKERWQLVIVNLNHVAYRATKSLVLRIMTLPI